MTKVNTFFELVWDTIALLKTRKSIKWIRNNKEPKIDSCGTLALILVQVDTWTLSKTLCCLVFKKSLKMFNKSPEISFFLVRR